MEAKGNSGKTVAKFALTATAMATTAVVKVVGKVQATTVMRAALMTAASGRDNGGSERW